MRHFLGEEIVPQGVAGAIGYLGQGPPSPLSPLSKKETITSKLLAGLPSPQIGSTGCVDREDLIQLIVTVSAGAVDRGDAQRFLNSAFGEGPRSVPYSKFIEYLFASENQTSP